MYFWEKLPLWNFTQPHVLHAMKFKGGLKKEQHWDHIIDPFRFSVFHIFIRDIAIPDCLHL